MIRGFVGQFFFLNNSYITSVIFEDIRYSSSEAAYQAQKCVDIKDKYAIAKMSPSEAREYVDTVQILDNWDSLKDSIMFDVCYAKFVQNPMLMEKLILTGDRELINYNMYGDTYWGVSENKGQNKLGVILKEIREYGYHPTEETAYFC